MIYRETGFIAVVCMIWLLPPPGSKLYRSHTGKLRKKYYLLIEGRGRGWGGAKSYDGEKAWSSTNHAILSASPQPTA
jgi:hypothetical protein